MINVRVAISLSDDPSTVRFFKYADGDDLESITAQQLDNLLLTHGDEISMETSFDNGYESRNATSLVNTFQLRPWHSFKTSGEFVKWWKDQGYLLETSPDPEGIIGAAHDIAGTFMDSLLYQQWV